MRFRKLLANASAVLPAIGAALYGFGAANATVLGMGPNRVKQVGVALVLLGGALFIAWAVAESLASVHDRQKLRGGLGKLSSCEQGALREVVEHGHKEAVEFSDELLEAIRQKTTFLTLAPKFNAVTRYLVNPEWRGALERWATPKLRERIARRWEDIGLRLPVYSKAADEAALMNVRISAQKAALEEAARARDRAATIEASTIHLVDAERAETANVRQELEAIKTKEAHAAGRARGFFQQLRYGRRLLDYAPADSQEYHAMVASVQELTALLDPMIEKAATLWSALYGIKVKLPETSPIRWLFEYVDMCDALFVRNAYRLLAEDLSQGRDPRPALVGLYCAYRNWRDEIVRMYGFCGKTFVSEVGAWMGAEKRFAAELEKKRRITLLGIVSAQVAEDDARHVAPLGEFSVMQSSLDKPSGPGSKGQVSA